MTKQNKIYYYILLVYMLLCPILDVANSFVRRYLTISVSIGVIFKGLFLIYFFWFFFFKAKNTKLKKILIVYLVILFLWVGLFILNRYSMLSLGSIISELIKVFKIFYFPIFTILLYAYIFENNIGLKEVEKIFSWLFIEYLILLFVPFITDTAYSSYFFNQRDQHDGFIGWFYAANELSPVTIILLFEFLNTAVDHKLKNLWLVLLFVFSTLLIGTKVAFLGVFAVLIYYLVRWLIGRNWKNVLFMVTIICFAVLATYNGVMMGKIDKMVTKGKNLIVDVEKENNKETDKEADKDSKPNVSTEQDKNKDDKKETNENIKQKKILNLILSGRYNFYLRTKEIYDVSRLSSKLVGIGFTSTSEVNNPNIERTIEIDILDIFFHCGILGFVIYLLPYILVFINIIKRLIKIKKINWNIVSCAYIFALLLGISLMAGHVLTAPSVSMLLSFIVLLIFINLAKMEDIANKKLKLKNRK